ncbi:MAG: hypothetical protein KC419_25925 [Anaerolineales bacterium]|nr:hypothetical protein [Anaerolineales bacterium]
MATALTAWLIWLDWPSVTAVNSSQIILLDVESARYWSVMSMRYNPSLFC